MNDFWYKMKKKEIDFFMEIGKTTYRGYKQHYWSLDVKERDNYTCQRCLKHRDVDNVKIEAHHIKEYHKYPELRYKVENGITLCDRCHHDLWFYSVFEKPKKKSMAIFNVEKRPEEMKDNEYIQSLKNCIE